MPRKSKKKSPKKKYLAHGGAVKEYTIVKMIHVNENKKRPVKKGDDWVPGDHEGQKEINKYIGVRDKLEKEIKKVEKKIDDLDEKIYGLDQRNREDRKQIKKETQKMELLKKKLKQLKIDLKANDFINVNEEKQFISKINDLIKDGWMPQGGIVTTYEPKQGRWSYFQAMVR